MHLEVLAANVMIPVMIWEDYWDGTSSAKTLAGLNMRKYSDKLDEFAFAGEKDYRGFREFLEKNSVLFRERYGLLRNLTDEEIDYIFTRIGEERIESSVFH